MLGLSARAKTVSIAALLGAATLALYAFRLSASPIYLAHDEVLFALQAHAVATTGRDVQGTAWPLYFPVATGYWAQPIVVYATALMLKVLPLSGAVVRLPAAIVGTADVVLMYVLARQLFERDDVAVFTAAMLALTPAHFLSSRLAVDEIYPLPFVTAWLLGLLVFTLTGRPRWLGAAVVALGVGFYTYIGSMLMMPVYVVCTLAVLLRRQAAAKSYGLAAAAFGLPLLPAGAWLLRHPRAHAELLSRYPLAASGATLRLHVLADRVSLYWSCLDPAFLFMSASDNPVNTTFRAGVFLAPMFVLLAVGAYRAATGADRRLNGLLLFGLLSAPLGVVLVGERTIPRLLDMLPFAILLAGLGCEHLLQSRQAWRLTALVLLALMPVQFAWYGWDYFTDYRRRVGGWLGHNTRAAWTEVMARTRPADDSRIYVAGDIPWADEYGRFYAIENRREDLPGRTTLFDPASPWTMPPHSVILTTYDPARHDARAAAAGAHRIATISDADDVRSFSVFEN